LQGESFYKSKAIALYPLLYGINNITPDIRLQFFLFNNKILNYGLTFPGVIFYNSLLRHCLFFKAAEKKNTIKEKENGNI